VEALAARDDGGASDDIRPALEEAFASGKTTCINVLTDPTTISPAAWLG